MDAGLKHNRRIALELKLIKCSGNAFQCFFADVMARRHKADYVRVAPYGKLGDKGCDGYLTSNGAVYACYGAEPNSKDKVKKLIAKIESDFDQAAKHLGAIMKEWHCAHNIGDLPTDAQLKLTQLAKANPHINFRFFGSEAMAAVIAELPEDAIEEFLGPAAMQADARNLQTEELRLLVDGLLVLMDGSAPHEDPPKPVSADKLDYNKLPGHWVFFLKSGWQNAAHVDTYLSRHPDPMAGVRIGAHFKTRYGDLKLQGLTAADTMAALYEHVAGIGMVSVKKYIAAQALLAHLFESCDILDDVPKPQGVE